MKKYGKSAKKGFTLVELIVVLVILAVLAAMLVPALTGYIKKAREEKEYQAASSVYTAAQALATEAYAKNDTVTATDINLKDIKTLTGLDNVTAVRVTFKTDNVTIDEIGVKFDSGKWYTYGYGDSSWEAFDTYSAGNAINGVSTT